MRDPKIQRAHKLVAEAIKYGRLTRPSTCSVCDRDPGKGRDGRSLIQGHHHRGYDRPLDVQWLCVQCHRDETPLNPIRGSVVKTSKLTEGSVLDILSRRLTSRDFAAFYGVSRETVQQIWRGVAWRHLSLLRFTMRTGG